METQTFNEWITNNPGKTLNDYYTLFGKPTTANHHANESHNNQNYIPPLKSPAISIITNIRIAPWRIFLYTGIVMVSGILWTMIFFFIFYGLAGHFLENLILHLSSGAR